MRSRTAVVLFGLVLLIVAGGSVLEFLADSRADMVGMIPAVVLAALGLRLALLVHGNSVGLWLYGVGLVIAVSMLGDGLYAYARHLGDPDQAWVRWAALIDSASWALVLLALAGLVFHFPTGTPPSRRWGRWGRWGAGAFLAVLLVELPFEADLGRVGGERVQSPMFAADWAETVNAVLAGIDIVLLLALLVGTVLATRWRVRRATGIERLQLWWLTYAAALLPLVIVLCLLTMAADGADTVAGVALVLVVPLLLGVAITIAITRHGLYAIDRLVSRTLVYLAVTVMLGALYAAVALTLGVVLGGGSSLAVAGATLAVAVAFRPARDAAQSALDRRFNRRRYEGLRRVTQFVEDVRAGREQPERIGAVMARALGDRSLEVLFWLPASERYATTEGRIVDLPEDARARTPVRSGDLELGVVVHDPRLREYADTLDSVVQAASLAIEIGRLRAELRVQLAEVEASRARIVTAAEAERRRLERDLHDGVQQRLVSLGLAVRHAQRLLGDDGEQVYMALDGVVDEVAAAVDELRQIARGLRPHMLDDGLGPALEQVAARAPVPVELNVLDEPLAKGVEADAFYVACEAVTNAVKHSGAGVVRVSAARRDGVLRVEVADDGVGGAVTAPGGGLVGLADRVAAHGGRLQVTSPVGGGTTVVAELPAA